MAERLLILGTGAMACWYAARLAPQADVTLAGQWVEGLAAIRQHGSSWSATAIVRSTLCESPATAMICRPSGWRWCW